MTSYTNAGEFYYFPPPEKKTAKSLKKGILLKGGSMLHNLPDIPCYNIMQYYYNHCAAQGLINIQNAGRGRQGRLLCHIQKKTAKVPLRFNSMDKFHVTSHMI